MSQVSPRVKVSAPIPIPNPVPLKKSFKLEDLTAQLREYQKKETEEPVTLPPRPKYNLFHFTDKISDK